jgi:hypothetical protein
LREHDEEKIRIARREPEANARCFRAVGAEDVQHVNQRVEGDFQHNIGTVVERVLPEERLHEEGCGTIARANPAVNIAHTEHALQFA